MELVAQVQQGEQQMQELLELQTVEMVLEAVEVALEPNKMELLAVLVLLSFVSKHSNPKIVCS